MIAIDGKAINNILVVFIIIEAFLLDNKLEGALVYGISLIIMANYETFTPFTT